MKIQPHKNNQASSERKEKQRELKTIQDKLGSLTKDDIAIYVWKLKKRVDGLETKVDKIETYLKNQANKK